MQSLAGGKQRVVGSAVSGFPRRLLAASGAQLARGVRKFWFRVQATAKQEPRCLHQGFSQYNEVVTVLEIPPDPVEPHHQPLAGSRVLLLDRTGNIHSVYRPDRVLTSAYWDVLATLPSMVPPGPLGLLGLVAAGPVDAVGVLDSAWGARLKPGAGTIPRIIAAHYPCRRKGDEEQDRNDQFVVHGWELDPGVIMASRLYLGMDELERNGHLVAHTGDALSPSASVPGGFSGIIVDLFAGGQLLPQLTKVSTWECIRDRLAEVGSGSGSGAGSGLVPRVIANLGQSPPAVPGMRWQAEAYTTLRAYEAMEKAFGGEVSLLSVESNTLALSGPLPGPSQWPDALPRGLAHLQVEAGSWARDVYPLQTAAVNLSLW